MLRRNAAYGDAGKAGGVREGLPAYAMEEKTIRMTTEVEQERSTTLLHDNDVSEEQQAQGTLSEGKNRVHGASGGPRLSCMRSKAEISGAALLCCTRRQCPSAGWLYPYRTWYICRGQWYVLAKKKCKGS